MKSGEDYNETGSTYGFNHLAAAAVAIAAAAVAIAALLYHTDSFRIVDNGLVELLKQNQILQAFIASSVLGATSYILILLTNSLLAWLRGRTYCSVTISSKDRNFEKVIDFIAKQGMVSSGCLIASTQKKQKTWKDWRIEFLTGQRKPPKMAYHPANNNDVHFIHYAGTNILMHRRKGETVIAGWERVPMEMETLTLSSWGSSTAPLKQLIDDALLASFEEEADELTVFVLADMWGGSWEKALSKKPRAIDSVILDADLADSLLADARDFLSSSDWYASVGIPYRRGYLLHGPPGCGKTSFCQALAGALKLDVCMLTLSNKNLDDNGLAAALRDCPVNAIVLLEDVDAVFVDRKLQTEGRPAAGVTFSGLLNALDGVASQEGRLFFMTTNHIEKLDAALIRPGRCDVKVEVKPASRTQARRLYSRFFVDASSSHAEAFSKSLPEYEISMAALQGYLLEHRSDPQGAIVNVQRLLRSRKPLSVDQTSVFDHFRRVGLEGWASLFEYHGYTHRSDLRGLSIDTVKKWSGFLRIDARSCQRMQQLLEENEQLMAEYQLADGSTIKDMLLATFASGGGAACKLVDDEPTDKQGNGGESTASEDDSCSSSSSFVLADAVAEEGEVGPNSLKAPLSLLADRLCATLQVDGKAAASVWQVRELLRQYVHSAEEAVAAAPVLVSPSPPCAARTLYNDDIGTYEWLRRAGLEKYAHALEDAGYKSARAIYGLGDEKLKDGCGIKDEVERKALVALANADESQSSTLLGFTSPGYATVRRCYLKAFQSAADDGDEGALAMADAAALEKLASSFASALCDDAGWCTISLFQLEQHLVKHKQALSPAQLLEAARACKDSVKAEFIDHVRPEKPPAVEPPVPTEWVYGWLEAQGLKEHAQAFIDQGMKEKADFALEPKITLDDLAKFGVQKAGEARMVLKMINEL